MNTQLPGQMSIMDVLSDLEAQRKVVRWGLCKEVAILDHKCDKLPEGMRFYKFRIEATPRDQHAFITEGRYEHEVVCPYCGRHVVYVFANTQFAGKKRYPC